MRFSKLAVAAVFALAASCGHAQNLVQDPGFESAAPGLHQASDPTPTLGDGFWTVTQGGVTVNNAPVFSHSGSQSLDLAPGNLGQIQQTLATVAGQAYTLSFFADSDFPVNTFAVMFDGALVPGSPTALPATGFTYQKYTFTGLVTSSNSTVLSFTANNIGDTFLDDVSVTAVPAAVPEPGSVALLVGMSLSGVGFLARRRKNARKAA